MDLRTINNFLKKFGILLVIRGEFKKKVKSSTELYFQSVEEYKEKCDIDIRELKFLESGI